MTLDAHTIAKDFPILSRSIRDGKRLVYLDSGATSQKPTAVIDAESDFYRLHNAAVHRGAHQLAEEATDAYEGARKIVAEFINAAVEEVVFTKSATESLNLVSYSMGNAEPGNRFHLKAGDSIVVTEMEHHANLIPWQELARRSGATLKWVSVNGEGRLDLQDFERLITSKTKIVSIAHQSNVLGTINPILEIAKIAKKHDAYLILDACQSVPHMKIDISKLGIDALVFSSHKMLGPTGVGVLWARVDLLDRLDPFLFGGSMIESVTMESATWAPIPRKFEAGVPNMAGVIGLGAAISYLEKVGLEKIESHLQLLTAYTLEKFKEVENLKLIGPKDLNDRGAVFSFDLSGIHPHDVGQALDQHGIAVRTGHHCAWPLMKKFGVVGTTRASLYLYNTKEDIDSLIEGLQFTQKYFKV